MANELFTANEVLQQFRRLTTPSGTLRATPELRLLLTLNTRKDAPTPSAIAKEWHVSRAMVTKAFAPLLEEGLVAKILNAKDKRSFAITITDTGREEAKRLEKTYLSALKQLKKDLGKKDFETLIAALKQANASLIAAK